MNKKIIIVVLIVLLACGGVSLFIFLNNNNDKETHKSSKKAESIKEDNNQKLSSVVEVGDYVAYIPDGKMVVKSEYATNHSKEQEIGENWSEWRVLSVDNGKVTLIGSPFGLFSDSVHVLVEDTFEGSTTDYESGKDTVESSIREANEPNRICEELYSSDIGKARSISIEDINDLLDVDLSDSKVKSYNDDYTPGETVEFEGHTFSSLYSYSFSDFTKEGSLEYELLGLSPTTSYYIAGTLGFAHEHMENTDPDDLPGIGTMDQYYIDYWVNNKGTINYQTYGNMRLLPVVELDEDVLLASDNEGDGSSYENAWRIDDEIEDVKVDDEEDAYENFLNHRYYYYDEMDDWETSIDREYALCDLNGDGIKELVIIGYYGNTIKDFYFTLIYTYDDKNNEVVFVDEFYSYAGLRFNEETKEIAYAELRPYRDAGGYTFYKFDGKELVEEKAAWYSYNDYHITEKDGTEKSVTAEEYTANFDGFNYLDYSEIKRK